MPFLESLGFADVVEAPAHRHVTFWATRDGARCGITLRNAPLTGFEAMALAERARDGGFLPVVVPRAGVRGDVAAWSARFGVEVVPEATLHAFEAAVAAEEAALMEERLAALEATLPPAAPAPVAEPAVVPVARDPYALGELGVIKAAAHAELLRIETEVVAEVFSNNNLLPVPVFEAPEEGLAAVTSLWEMPLAAGLVLEEDEPEAEFAEAAALPWEPAAAAPAPRADLDATGLPWGARPATSLPWDGVTADPEVVKDVAEARHATRALGRFLANAAPDPRVTLNDPDLWGTRNRLEDIRGRLNHENVALSVEGVKSDWLKRVADDEDQ